MGGSAPRTTIGRGAHRPTPLIRRASAGPVAGRVLAGLILVASAAALYGMTASPAFRLRDGGVIVRGADFTDEATVLAAIGLDGGARPNLFTLDTARLAANLLALPAVDSDRADAASVHVALPDRLVVDVHERVPILVWQAGDRRLLVDVHGVVVSELGPDAQSELPAVADERAASAELAIGDRIAADRHGGRPPHRRPDADLPGQHRHLARDAHHREGGLRPPRPAEELAGGLRHLCPDAARPGPRRGPGAMPEQRAGRSGGDHLGRLPLPGRRPLRHVPAEDASDAPPPPRARSAGPSRVGRLVERGHGCRW